MTSSALQSSGPESVPVPSPTPLLPARELAELRAFQAWAIDQDRQGNHVAASGRRMAWDGAIDALSEEVLILLEAVGELL